MFENRDKPEWPVRKILWESTYILYIVIITGQVWESEPGTKGWEVLSSIILLLLFCSTYVTCKHPINS